MLPALRDLDEAERLALLQAFDLHLGEPGEVIVTEGETGPSLFLVTGGEVKVFRNDAEGRARPLGRLGEGSLFGDIATLARRPQGLTATAAAACELLRLDGATLEALAPRHPRLREAFERFYAEVPLGALAAAPGTPAASADPVPLDWLVGLVRETLQPVATAHAVTLPPEYEAFREVEGLALSPLLEGLDAPARVGLLSGLPLRTVDTGDVALSEGEPPGSVFVVARGAARVHVRDRAGRSRPLCALGPGAFFGETSGLPDTPRTATVTAAAPSLLLELDEGALRRLAGSHPPLRGILEQTAARRASDPQAAALRAQG